MPNDHGTNIANDMMNESLHRVDFSSSADFAKHCRRLVLEDGAIIVEGLESGDLQEFIRAFGPIVKQHDGNETFEVSPSEELGSIYHSRTTNAVPAHTDGHDILVPPNFFFLLCVRPSREADGLTEVSSVSSLLNNLSEKEIDVLTTHQFCFGTKPSSTVMKSGPVYAPIYDAQKDIFRYSYNYLSNQSTDGSATALIEKINRHHQQHKQSVLLGSKDLLICENYHVLHSRTGFSGADRKLVRAWTN